MSTAYAKFSGLVAGGGGGSGTVTSVALADGSSTPIYTVSGSPVTTSGTLTETLKTQVKNTLFVGPASGADAQPTFRAVVAADVPIDTILPSQTGNNGKFLTTNGSAASWGTAGGSAPTSRIGLNSPTGFGSTGTKIRVYSNVFDNNGGSDLTYTSDATNGDFITCVTAGVYAVTIYDCNTGAALGAGVSLNATGGDLSTNIESLSLAKRWAYSSTITQFVGGVPGTISQAYYVPAGGVLRFHGSGTLCNLTGDIAQFRVQKIS